MTTSARKETDREEFEKWWDELDETDLSSDGCYLHSLAVFPLWQDRRRLEGELKAVTTRLMGLNLSLEARVKELENISRIQNEDWGKLSNAYQNQFIGFEIEIDSLTALNKRYAEAILKHWFGNSEGIDPKFEIGECVFCGEDSVNPSNIQGTIHKPDCIVLEAMKEVNK